MQKLMRSSIVKSIVVFVVCVFTGKAQTTNNSELGYLLSDALFYSEQYITPATDAAVYQASSSWMNSAKKKKKWQVDIGLHANVFFVPNRDQSFDVDNNDFQFFHIENESAVTVPTAIGNDTQYYLVGEFMGNEVRFKTPEGVNQKRIAYPYLQASLGLPLGFEFVGRYSTRTKLKKGEYQVYGFGLKHNFSQYFKSIEENKIYFSAMAMYSNEEISFDFLNVSAANIDFGLDQLTGFVDTYHFQASVSKEIKKFEIMLSAIINTSDFKYRADGSGRDENLFKNLINEQLTSLSDTKTNFMGEVGFNYFFNDFFVKSSFSFGKFTNINVGLNYAIN
ncbi:DUF6588 family protein [Flavobacterium chuncheonense]|uniref:DUF6588 family protein n=1 Tax=Flavobacterium chuncheonense TaxID=2026653 RepID=A0ABW5YPL4_9FLAO